MKIVLDCNVIISAAITDGTCRRVVKEAIINHDIYVCEEILVEIQTVAQRPKFKNYYTILFELLELVLSEANLVKIHKIPSPKLLDKNDEPYVKTALAADCDYLITGNSKDFSKQYGKTKVVSAKEFLNLFYH